MRTVRSQTLFHNAQRYLPGGVNSPVRSFNAVGGEPIFVRQGQGSKIYDVDDNEFIDYLCSWGALILGHSHPNIINALKLALENGTSFGIPTELETNLAELITAAVPSVEMVRLVNSGTEAVMSAIRLARAYTGRNKIVKFTGCYHGHADGLLVKAGSGAATLATPTSLGVPPSLVKDTLLAPYNDLHAVESLFETDGKDIAAVIVEPIAANMGVIPPKPNFLQGLRQVTQSRGAILIFDEVITGFRVAYGGAQALYGITPDLTCLGKIIGGGLPVGAYGGRRDIMSLVAPSGNVYQAGTLSGNPLTMTAGIETLRVLAKLEVYEQLEKRAALLVDGLSTIIGKSKVPAFVSRVGSIFSISFSDIEVSDYETAQSSNTNRHSAFFHRMLEQGIYLPPSQFEAAFVSLAHTEEDIENTVLAAAKAFPGRKPIHS